MIYKVKETLSVNQSAKIKPEVRCLPWSKNKTISTQIISKYFDARLSCLQTHSYQRATWLRDIGKKQAQQVKEMMCCMGASVS